MASRLATESGGGGGARERWRRPNGLQAVNDAWWRGRSNAVTERVKPPALMYASSWLRDEVRRTLTQHGIGVASADEVSITAASVRMPLLAAAASTSAPPAELLPLEEVPTYCGAGAVAAQPANARAVLRRLDSHMHAATTGDAYRLAFADLAAPTDHGAALLDRRLACVLPASMAADEVHVSVAVPATGRAGAAELVLLCLPTSGSVASVAVGVATADAPATATLACSARHLATRAIVALRVPLLTTAAFHAAQDDEIRRTATAAAIHALDEDDGDAWHAAADKVMGPDSPRFAYVNGAVSPCAASSGSESPPDTFLHGLPRGVGVSSGCGTYVLPFQRRATAPRAAEYVRNPHAPIRATRVTVSLCEAGDASSVRPDAVARVAAALTGGA